MPKRNSPSRHLQNAVTAPLLFVQLLELGWPLPRQRQPRPANQICARSVAPSSTSAGAAAPLLNVGRLPHSPRAAPACRKAMKTLHLLKGKRCGGRTPTCVEAQLRWEGRTQTHRGRCNNTERNVRTVQPPPIPLYSKVKSVVCTGGNS